MPTPATPAEAASGQQTAAETAKITPLTEGGAGDPKPLPLTGDNHPDSGFRQMIAARKAKAPGDAAKPAEATTKEAQAATNKPIGELLSSALQFRTKPKAEKAADKPDGDKPTADAKPAETAKETPAVTDPPKAKPAKKKAEPQPAADPSRMIQDVASATAAAVTKVLSPGRTETPDPMAAIEATLSGREKHELDVAKYMAKNNPDQHRDAPKIYLANVKSAEEYRQRWLNQNPGKAYDPDDDEHSDFFDSLKEPYSDYEFEQARAEAAAERVASRREAKTEKRIQEVEQDAAHTDLRRVTESTMTGAFGLLVGEVDKAALTDLNKGGWEALAERDPILAPVLAAAVGEMEPMIRTIVEIDDPKGRIKLDVDGNPQHAAWGHFLIQKESELTGETDADGRVFATRDQFRRMSAAQQQRHWYLTTDHLLQAYVEETKEKVSSRVKSERARIEKAAKALGYQIGTGSPTPQATTGEKPSGTATVTEKPISPSSSSGSKTDLPSTPPAGSVDRALKSTSAVLFGS